MLKIFPQFIFEFMQSKNLWYHGGLMDVKQKYRRSKIGHFWNTLVIAIFLLMMGPVYSKIFGSDLKSFFPYLSIGFILWIFFSQTINESCNVFQENSGHIKQSRVFLVGFTNRLVMKNFLHFLHTIIILPLIFLVSSHSLEFTFFLALPSVFLFTIFITLLSFVVAIISSRFRDIPPLINSLLMCLFFLSPIIWEEAKLQLASPEIAFILSLNPISVFLELIRNPILGITPNINTLMISISYILFLFIFACYLNNKVSHRVVYWL